MPILVIDVGNSRTSLACCHPGGKLRRIRHIPRECANVEAIQEAISDCLQGKSPSDTVAATVVPRMKSTCHHALKIAGLQPPHWVDHHSPLGIGVDFSTPEQVGADRLANAAGAARKFGVPVVVIDAGTALTFDVVLPDRGYCGGIIAPGQAMMLDSLAEKTALLPQIVVRKNNWVFGRSTKAAMQIGSQIGYRGMVRELVAHLREGIGGMPFTLCLTGGYAAQTGREFDEPVIIDPQITLFGLGVIGENLPK